MLHTVTALEALLTGYVILYGLGFAASEWRARRAIQHARGLGPASGALPSVTLIIPVKGADESSESNFRSWLEQAYPGGFQIIFSLQDPRDSALAVLKQLRPVRPFEVIINPIRLGMHGKTSNLYHAVLQARGEVLVMSDADIFAPPGTLLKVVGELERGAGLVSCLAGHVRALNFWAKLYATVWNDSAIRLWAPLMLDGYVCWIIGETVGIRRRDLERIGGMESFAGFIGEDAEMGRLARKAGLRLALGPWVLSPTGKMRFWEVRQKFIRVSMSVLFQSSRGQAMAGMLYRITIISGYLPLLLFGAVTGVIPLIVAGGALALIRVLFMGRLPRLAGEGFDLIPYVLISDILLLAAHIQAWVRPVVRWGGIDLRVGRNGRVEQYET